MKLLLESWRKYLNEEASRIPTALYHATYGPLLGSIESDGLGGNRETYWEDSQRGIVYLALDPGVAYSYAETSDAAWDKFEGDEGLEIVTLEVDTSQLNLDLFKLDSNVVDNEGDTVEYHGVVPPSAIEVVGREFA